jgi:hypothetical protein
MHRSANSRPAIDLVLLPLPPVGEGWGEGRRTATTLTPTLSRPREREQFNGVLGEALPSAPGSNP